MTALADHQDQTHNLLRRALGLPTAGGYIWDGQDLHGPCEACGRQAQLTAPPPLPEGTPVVDLVPDPHALDTAARTVRMLVDVLDQRRPPHQLRERVHPRVLRYVNALPSGHQRLPRRRPTAEPARRATP
ncbi:hypothetical protein [Pseudonocardia xishanensis]|uniref:Uncharacterized protein n=1 Tax=Pseudonocardia xishanensis TaxID=630995 RepID=A0ABP8S2T4_9PSEU